MLLVFSIGFLWGWFFPGCCCYCRWHCTITEYICYRYLGVDRWMGAVGLTQNDVWRKLPISLNRSKYISCNRVEYFYWIFFHLFFSSSLQLIQLWDTHFKCVVLVFTDLIFFSPFSHTLAHSNNSSLFERILAYVSTDIYVLLYMRECEYVYFCVPAKNTEYVYTILLFSLSLSLLELLARKNMSPGFPDDINDNFYDSWHIHFSW